MAVLVHLGFFLSQESVDCPCWCIPSPACTSRTNIQLQTNPGYTRSTGAQFLTKPMVNTGTGGLAQTTHPHRMSVTCTNISGPGLCLVKYLWLSRTTPGPFSQSIQLPVNTWQKVHWRPSERMSARCCNTGETSTELSQVRLTKQDNTWAILSQSIQLPVNPVTAGTLETIGENVCPLLHFCRNINTPSQRGGHSQSLQAYPWSIQLQSG